MAFSKIHPIAFSISISVISGLSALGAGLLALIFTNGKPVVSMMGTMYVTYNPSVLNSAIGAAIVFINAFIAVYITAWLYNLLIDYI